MMKIKAITAGSTTRSVFLARRELDLFGDGPLRFLHEADDIAVSDVELYIGPEQAVFALDHRRAFDDPHIGHLREGDLRGRTWAAGHRAITARPGSVRAR